MPCLDDIIGLSGFQIQNVLKGKSIEVIGRYVHRPACAHCGAKGCRIKSSFWRRLRHSRQGNQLIELVIRSHKYVCLVCRRYFNLRIPGILPRRKATENFRLEVYEKHHGGLSQRLLSKTHGIGEATVERWYRDFVVYRVKELSNRHSPRVLGIDEHFFTRKQGYATTLCDLGNHKVHDVILGKSEAALRQPLAMLRSRERTKIVVMDLSDTYRSIARKHFPNAMIIADRFHVIRLVNHSFLKAWQQLDPAGRKNRGLLSLMRRHDWKLSEEQKENLESYLQNHQVLREVYYFKQRLNHILLLRGLSRRGMRPHLRTLLEMIAQLKAGPLHALKTLGETLDSWVEEIGRMLRFSKSNGITEGFHNKMEMISRRAFGFRNFQNYRLRVLAHCGWDGVFAIRN
jgi:transposase